MPRSSAAQVTGEDRLDNPVIIVVSLIAIAQALTIVLTIRRERDVKELRRLVDEQRLQIAELKASLARRNADRPRPPKTQREPTSLRAALKSAVPPEPAITPKDFPDNPSTIENKLERTTNVIDWLNRVAIDHTAAVVRNSGSKIRTGSIQQ